MAKQATTTKTAAKPGDSKEELVRLEVTSNKVIKIGNMRCGKGAIAPAIAKSTADKLVADGVAVIVY